MRAAQQGFSIDWLVVGITGAALIALGTISPTLLTFLKIHYTLPGGLFLEKLHPATYLTMLAFLLLLLRGDNFVGELDRIISGSKLLIVYFFTCALLAFWCVALKRPFANVADTFILPALLALIIWNLSPAHRKPLVVCVHLMIWLNIALGFYEYFSKHRLIPLTVGKLVVTGDWRSTALLGYPLAAAGTIAVYIMALVLRPRLRTPSPAGIAAVLIAAASLMAFGGRTALVFILVVFTCMAIAQLIRLVQGESVGLPAVILATCSLMFVGMIVAVLLSSGTFDNMITRFSSDNGSARARLAGLQLITLFDWKELMFGPDPVRAGSLQSMMGLDFGIENFWIACIVQYGVIQTTLITIGLGCFFAEMLRRTERGAWVVVLFLCVVAASSVSFSSKGTTLAIYVTITCLLMARTMAEKPVLQMRPHRHAAPSLVPSH